NLCQYFRPVWRDGNGVLKMCGGLSVQSDDGPAVVQHANAIGTEINHRLDGQNHSRLDLRSLSILDVVQHWWILMERPADALAAEFANDSEVMSFGTALNRGRDIRDVVPGFGLLDAAIKGLFGDLQQVFDRRRDFSDRYRHCGVAVISVVDDAEIQTDH